MSYWISCHIVLFVSIKKKRKRGVHDAKDVQIRIQVRSEVDFKLDDAFRDSSRYLNVKLKELLQGTILVNPGHIS